jgi:hypothetical protein
MTFVVLVLALGIAAVIGWRATATHASCHKGSSPYATCR